MENLDWSTLENLRSYGIESITVENPSMNLAVTGDEFGALRIDNGPNYNIELNLNSDGLKRLQDALAKEPRKPEDELRHELQVMHNVNDCKGKTINEKIDRYFEKVDSKAKACKVKNNVRYKIRHR